MCNGSPGYHREGIKKLTVYGDSALVICQLNGEWETRDSKLVPYQEYLADALVTLATMFNVNANVETQLVKLEV